MHFVCLARCNFLQVTYELFAVLLCMSILSK
jgi:hypothetical protein